MFSFLNLSILLIICAPFSAHSLRKYDVTFDQAKFLSSNVVDGVYNIRQFRAAKFNRTATVLNVDLDLYIDLDESIFVEVTTYRSRLSNNQYERLPFGVPNMTWTEYTRRYYKPVLMKGFGECSNLPQFESDSENYMWPKGSYFVKDYTANADLVPPALPAGMYKILVTLTTTDKICAFELILRFDSLLSF